MKRAKLIKTMKFGFNDYLIFLYRLIALWRLLYKKTLWYQAQLSRRIPDDDRQLTENITHEVSLVKTLLCHVQANLQVAGDSLSQALELTALSG